MEANHRIRSFEQEMEELEAIKRQQQTKAETGNVPCNGCTLCCRNDAIRLLPQDDPAQYQTVPHDHFPGHLMLAHKENGDCVYLTSEGCDIHGSKPTMCIKMDCRRIAKTFKKRDLKRYNVPVPVWNKGRILACR
jgi:hypothetical protein